MGKNNTKIESARKLRNFAPIRKSENVPYKNLDHNKAPSPISKCPSLTRIEIIIGRPTSKCLLPTRIEIIIFFLYYW